MYSLAIYIRRNIRAANAKVRMTISTADPPWSVWLSLGCWPCITSGDRDDLLWLCCWARRCRGLMEVFLAAGWVGCSKGAAEGFWTPYYKILRNFAWNWHIKFVYILIYSRIQGISVCQIWLRTKTTTNYVNAEASISPCWGSKHHSLLWVPARQRRNLPAAE